MGNMKDSGEIINYTCARLLEKGINKGEEEGGIRDAGSFSAKRCAF